MKAAEVVGRLPLHFESNKGQSILPGVDFISHGNGFTVYLTPQGPIMMLRAAGDERKGHRVTPMLANVVGMQLLGAQPGIRAEAMEPMPGKVNYFVGNDPAKWITGVATYGRVRYQGVYPGIDLVYYGNQRNLEYDFVVAPGANPTQIRISLQGMDKAEMDTAGNLVLSAGSGQMVKHRPAIYQELDGTRQLVSGEYVLNGPEVSFKLGAYDRGRPLVIDPTFTFGSLLGGDGEDKGHGIGVDPAGNIYVSGATNSLSVAIKRATDPPNTVCPYKLPGSNCAKGVPFPIINWWTTPAAGVGNPNATPAGNTCCLGSDAGLAFVAKLDPTGSTLLYASYIGGFSGYRNTARPHVHGPCPADIDAAGQCAGSDAWAKGWDEAFALAVDTQGRAYIGGHAESMDFPTTADAIKKSRPGPLHPGFPAPDLERDSPMYAFLAIFEPNGKLKYSTLIGGHSDGTKTNGISVVDTGAYQGIWVTGEATATSFFSCTTPTGCGDRGPVNSSLNPDGLAGMPAVNSYQTQLAQAPCTNSGPRTLYSGATVRYPGGQPLVGCVKPITAPVACHDPATGALQDGTRGRGMSCWDNAFIFRLTLDGTSVIWSTLLGGTGDGAGYTIKADPATGIAYYVGDTEATDFPTTVGAFQTCHSGNGGYPSDISAPATNSTNAPNAGKGYPNSFRGYTPQAAVTGHLATKADITPGSIFPCHLSPSPQTWDFEVTPPTQKWKSTSQATVARFGPTGALLYSSYLGGSGDNSSGAPANNFSGGLGSAADFDRLGNVYMSGWTESRVPYCGTPAGSSAPHCNPYLNDPRRTSFPVTAGAFQKIIAQDPTPTCSAKAPPDCVAPNKRLHGNSFVTKINTTKKFPGGWNGTVPVPTGTGFVWSTYIGGYGDEEVYGLVVEKGPGTGCPNTGTCNPAVYIYGFTDSWNFPICGNRLGPAIGPNCQQGPLDTTQAGSATMTSPSYNGKYLDGIPPNFVKFPPKPANGFPGGYDSSFPPQYTDALLVKLKPDGSGLVYSTYIGGRSDEEGHNIVYVNTSIPTAFRGVYVTGLTNSDGRGYCGQGTPSTPQMGSGTIPPPPTWTCTDPDMNIPPGNPFPTSAHAFQTRHSPSRVDPGTGSYPNAVLCTGPSSPSWTGTDPDCRHTPVPANPNEDAYAVKIAD